MSMHIKSPAGTPDIAVHSVRVKPTTASKTVTANGTYNASTDNVDGYSSVTVNVEGGLPVEFLKSIKSQGNSIIVTDIVLQPSWQLDLTFKASSTSLGGEAGWFVGSFRLDSGNNVTDSSVASFSANQIIVAFGQTFANSRSMRLYSEDYNSINTLILRNGNYCTYNTDYLSLPTPTLSNSIPISISGITKVDDETVQYIPYNEREVTFYGAKIYDGSGNLAHNFVPAKSKVTNRGGMYDTITATFYPSSADYDDFIKEAIT